MSNIGLLKNYHGEKVFGELPHSKDHLLLNVFYHRPDWESPGKHDYASIVFKDVNTGRKWIQTIEDPRYMMYIVKPQYRDYTHYPSYMPLDRCDQKIVKFKNIINEIVKVGGKKLADYKEWCNKNNKSAKKNLHHYPYVLATDYPYTNYFRCEWMLHYHDYDMQYSLTKVFADIEVDGIDAPGFPTADICPINAVAVVDAETKTVHSFLLRNPENPLIEQFEKNLPNFIDKCHNTFDESYGELNYEIHMYDTEIDMITEVFRLFNTLARDFILFWNMAFDIPYFIDRIKALGHDPMKIMCDPEFIQDELYYRKDHRHHDFKTKNDVFTCTSKSVYLDQMSQYIKIRKARSELKTVRLNAIAKAELNDEKLDYSDEANIKTLPYENYELFVLYNIKDTLLQYGIEMKTHDIDNVFQRSLINATQYESAFSQTILLKNRAYLSYYKQGFIIGNNNNIDYGNRGFDNDGADKDEDDDEEGFAGALVGDPMLNEKVGVEILGRPSKFIFSRVIDYDFSSMYPNITITHNIGTVPMIGKIKLEGFGQYNTDPDNVFYDEGQVFLEDYLSKDYSFIGNRYFGLPTGEELIKEFGQYGSA
ncbi:MAG: hypothetical protein HXL57_00335 [Solobacterium sp.]|nr:hypothetical protein [Solobacterium sp.]